MEPVDEEGERGVPRRLKIRLAVALTIAALATGAWAYVRYGVTKHGLGGPCSWAMHCNKDAPRCMRPNVDEDGVCSRPCDPPGKDCAPGVACLEIDLDERDERGMPLKSGYCFPQTFLDHLRKKPAKDAGPAPAPSVESWLDVPAAAGQLEGEITFEKRAPVTFKGALSRPSAQSGRRTIADADGMRLVTVNDDAKTFSATAITVNQGDAQLTKTGKKDTVAGKECELWQLDGNRKRAEACVVPGAAFVDPSSSSAPWWTKELAVRGALPLRVIEMDASGKETGRTTATKLDLHPVDASLFVVPKTYKNLAGR